MNVPRFTSPGPNLSTLLAPGSIFATPLSLGENDVTFFAGIWMAGTGVTSGTVPANGLLATVYIDTTGVFQWYMAIENGRHNHRPDRLGSVVLSRSAALPRPVINEPLIVAPEVV